MEQLQLPIRNAGLYSAIRQFVTSAFELLRAERAEGADVSFSVEEHRRTADDRPFFEYRPMLERFIRDRAHKLAAMPGADDAAWAVASDPASAAFLRAGRANMITQLEDAARDELLIPFLITMAELDPSFELNEDHVLGQYLKLEKALYAEQRRYAAVTPLWGVRLMYGDMEIAPGVTMRQVDPEMFRMEWAEAAQMNWGDLARDGLPSVVLQFERAVGPEDPDHVLDPLPAIVQVVSAIRALAGGSVHAGPVVLERLDYATMAPRPVPALAARPCGVLPSKIDGTVARGLPTALRRLASDPNGSAACALERYQYAATAPGLSALRAIMDSIVEIYAVERDMDAAALRMATVIGSSLPERRIFLDAMRRSATTIRTGSLPTETTTADTRVLAAGLRATVAAALVGELPLGSLREYADGVLLGERERKQLGVAAMRPSVDNES